MAYYSDWRKQRKERFFVKAQTVIGTATQETATDGFQALSVDFNHLHENQMIEDNHEGRSKTGIVQFQDGPHGAQIVCYVRPTGTPGGQLDIHAILDNFFELETRSAVTVATGGTSSFTTSNTGVYDSGDFLYCPEAKKVVRVDSVVNLSGVDTVTLDWAPGVAISNGATIPANIQIKPRVDIDENKFFTLVKHTPIGIHKISGCQAMDFKVEGNSTAKWQMTINVQGQHVFGGGRLVLGADLNDSATSMTVTAATAYTLYGLDSNHYLLYDVGSETIKLTAISGTTVTIERAQLGTVAASHTTGANVDPYTFTPTYSGTPVSGILGALYLAGSYFDVTTGSFSTNENFEAIDKTIGNSELTTFVAPAEREVSFSITARGKKDLFLMHFAANDREPGDVLLQGGKESGSTVAFHSSSVYFNAPVNPNSPATVVPYNLDSYAVTSSEEDDCFHGIIT